MKAKQLKYKFLSAAAEAPAKVGAMTHGFYRYPARFGEVFVREAIAQFSRKGDVVLDPFCGGGTTIVEALSCGRKAIGADISPLAIFVARVKTTPLSERQLRAIGLWVGTLQGSTKALLKPNEKSEDYRLVGLPKPYRNLLSSLKESSDNLPKGDCRNFAKCLLMKVAQWAFDGKQHVPTPKEIVSRIDFAFTEMKSGMQDYIAACEKLGSAKALVAKNRSLKLGSAIELNGSSFNRKVSLVITSPPYLGVHVLYNKWQLKGRRELRAAFFLCDMHDIGGASAYTIIDRQAKSDDLYYSTLKSSFQAVKKTLTPGAYVIQLVSFDDAEIALPKYLVMMKSAGLELCDSYVKDTKELQWRSVPGRRWYARVGAIKDSSASKEVLLVHRVGRGK